MTYWFCKCECGNVVSVAKGSLLRGLSRSCGCARKPKEIKTNKYDLSGEYGIGWTTNTNNEFYFDLEDYDKIKGYCWYENDNGYVVTQRGRKTIRLHRLIMGVTDPKIQIDHVFHNIKDNRKEYLREATNTQNSWNKKSVGVYYLVEKKKYVGHLTCNGERHFKYFDTFEEARQYREELEKKYYKEFRYKEKEE